MRGALAVHARTNNPIMQKTAKDRFTDKDVDLFTGVAFSENFGIRQMDCIVCKSRCKDYIICFFLMKGCRPQQFTGHNLRETQ